MEPLDYKYIATLVMRAQTGDSDAFAELYAATYQREYYFAYRYLKDEYLAQDALQETYILALKNLTRLKDPTLVISWLNQINFRVCYNMNVKQKRYNQEMETSSAVINNIRSDHGNEGTGSPEDAVIYVDSQEFLINEILKLPFTESQVILLKYYKEMKLDEIALLMDISKSTVKRYLNTGREHLAQALKRDRG